MQRISPLMAQPPFLLPEFLERGEGLGAEPGDVVPGEVEVLEVGGAALEGGLADLGDAVARQAQAEKVPAGREGAIQ